MIKRVRGGSIEDLKLRREEERNRCGCKDRFITTCLIQVKFEAVPLTVGLYGP